RPISEMVAVMVDGHRFLVQVVEESLGETIFSRGIDHKRAPMMYNVGNAIHSAVNNGGGGTSIVPVSLLDNRGNRRLVMPVKSSGNDNGEDSNSPIFNDDSFCKQIDRQSHHMEKAEQKLGNSSMVEPSIGGYVSFLGRTSTGAFMEDETNLIKRREE
ncbi:hypothetical protein Ancab_015441, partial [Ancistrocladus abbreviatus]